MGEYTEIIDPHAFDNCLPTTVPLTLNWGPVIGEAHVTKDTAMTRAIDENDLIVELYHPHGQVHGITADTDLGVRLIHCPTGITTQSDSERSQLANKAKALRELETLLAQISDVEWAALNDPEVRAAIKAYHHEAT